VSALHVADTGLFVALGSPSNERYQAVQTFARRNGIVFELPDRVYDELTVTDTAERTPPADVAIESGWATVADPLDFSRPVVSRVMDGVQRYIANADDRPAAQVERADAALAALVAERLDAGEVADAYVYTTDVAAGEAAETVLASEGFGDSVTFVNGFQFVEDLRSGDSGL
jgi:hypothetical protein